MRWFKSGNLYRRLHHKLGRRLWDGYVPDVAELAMQVFGSRAMHVADRMRGETGYCDQQNQRQ